MTRVRFPPKETLHARWMGDLLNDREKSNSRDEGYRVGMYSQVHFKGCRLLGEVGTSIGGGKRKKGREKVREGKRGQEVCEWMRGEMEEEE